MKTKEDVILSWEEYTVVVWARFGNYAYDDPLTDLKNLRKVDSLQNYLNRFDELYPKTRIRDDQALSFFFTELIDELQIPIRMFKPKTYLLAKL